MSGHRSAPAGDPMDRLRQLRPEVPDEDGWATSPAGRQAFTRLQVVARAPRTAWWRRRLFVLPTLAVGLGAAVAGGAAFAGAGRQSVTTDDLVCVADPSPQADVYGVTIGPGQTRPELARVCRDQWSDAVPGRPAPVAFVLCVYPVARGQVGGALVGVPTATSLPESDWPAACQAAGFDPLG